MVLVDENPYNPLYKSTKTPICIPVTDCNVILNLLVVVHAILFLIANCNVFWVVVSNGAGAVKTIVFPVVQLVNSIDFTPEYGTPFVEFPFINVGAFVEKVHSVGVPKFSSYKTVTGVVISNAPAGTLINVTSTCVDSFKSGLTGFSDGSPSITKTLPFISATIISILL